MIRIILLQFSIISFIWSAVMPLMLSCCAVGLLTGALCARGAGKRPVLSTGWACKGNTIESPAARTEAVRRKLKRLCMVKTFL